jgi:hypothetical protein
MSHTGLENGWSSHVVIEGGEVVKTSLRTFDTPFEAEESAEQIVDYAAQLTEELVPMASLHSTSVVGGDGDGYHVRHTYSLVDGPSINRLPQADLRRTVSEVISLVVGMSTLRHPDVLAVPIDAKPQNFHIDAQGSPLLIDIFPALSRHGDGSFPLERLTLTPGRIFPWSMGTKSGVVAKLLSASIDRGDTLRQKVGHLLTTTDEWCYDMLPIDVHPQVKDRVRRNIRMRFAPYLARVTGDKILKQFGRRH